ncbi:hybrid sensor histidine kinase/response regulator [Rhodoferax sp.]|uniref:ATP-binding response regulator n=1 Tax=Rhodoferax sp. TaxID=50421 RepID=UPI0025F1D2C1|nr:hybrid sensor histidine kinase/response regulator [Rhodoferax sp.]
MYPPTPTEDSLTVMVADDIGPSRQQLIQVVRELGHVALEAASGAEALYLIERNPPDVLLLDLLMPDMDGFAVARAVRQQITGKWLPVIVLSALKGDEHFARALASGAADFLVKPVSPVIMRAKLRQYQRVLNLQSRVAMMAKRQQAINEHITDAIITIDEHGLVCELNRAARALFAIASDQDPAGMALQTLTGLDVAELLDRPEVALGANEQVRTPFSVSHERWSIGSQTFRTIALHDLRETRRIERMKDEFLAMVSHELRTPLTSILGALGLLAVGSGGSLPEAALVLLQVAKRNGDRLNQLIDDVLDLTKLEGNHMPLNLRPVELAPLIRESLSANTSYAQRTDVSLVFDDAAPDCLVQMDPDRFLQVMANLLSNAIKHSPAGKTVRVLLTRDWQTVQVAVVDEGPGIDPAFRKRLFEKFSQADASDRRPVGGTGLGLYISRILVEKMGGTVSADAGDIGGSTFRVSLPCLQRTPDGPWILCLAHDHQQQERLADWLGDLAPVDVAANLAGAETLIRQRGLPAVLLANPQAQGPADDFCACLQRQLTPARVLLVSDALNAGFAARYGMGWLAASGVKRQDMQASVAAILAQTGKGVG